MNTATITWDTIVAGVFGSPSGYLLLEPRTEREARDDVFRSDLRRARHYLAVARQVRYSGKEHATWMLHAANARKMAMRRVGIEAEHRWPVITSVGIAPR